MIRMPKCDACKWSYFIEKDGICDEACKAYPDGIPDERYYEPKEKECKDGYKFETEYETE